MYSPVYHVIDFFCIGLSMPKHIEPNSPKTRGVCFSVSFAFLPNYRWVMSYQVDSDEIAQQLTKYSTFVWFCRRQRTYHLFIDFKQAYDNVWNYMLRWRSWASKQNIFDLWKRHWMAPDVVSRCKTTCQMCLLL